MKHSIKFHNFIEHQSDFSLKEQQQIISSIDSVQNRKIIQLVLMLITWNIIALIIEWTILGGSIMTALVNGIDWIYIFPEIGFLLSNFTIKSLWVKAYMKKDLSWRNTFISSIPSAGPFIILVKFMFSHKLTIDAVKEYAHFRKREIFKMQR